MEYSKKIPVKKSWGQNFIIDQNVINKIISIINPNSNDIILEIGPGKGALTIPLSKKIKKLYAVEIDPLLVKYLKSKKINNTDIINKDILKTDLNSYNESTKIIGNLPYYITSPIIFKMIENNVNRMFFMVQKEVAERIVSVHNNKNYSRISVMVQTFYNCEINYSISKNVFIPKPKVNSAIIKFKKKDISNIDYKKYSNFVKAAFKQKRKKIKNNLKNIINENGIEIFGERRAENISIDEYIKIFNNYML